MDRCRSEPPKPSPNVAPSSAAAANTNGQECVSSTGTVTTSVTAIPTSPMIAARRAGTRVAASCAIAAENAVTPTTPPANIRLSMWV